LVIGGVDTHKDLHVAAVVDADGALLGTESFSTTRAGYRALVRVGCAASATSGESESGAPAVTAPDCADT
jgi:hypothetical protein